jgi:hypothetical protein
MTFSRKIFRTPRVSGSLASGNSWMKLKRTLVDETRDSLDTTSSSKSSDCGLSDTPRDVS